MITNDYPVYKRLSITFGRLTQQLGTLKLSQANLGRLGSSIWSGTGLIQDSSRQLLRKHANKISSLLILLITTGLLSAVTLYSWHEMIVAYAPHTLPHYSSWR